MANTLMGRLALAVLSSLVCLTAFAQAQTTPPPTPKFGPQWQVLSGAWTSEASTGVGAGGCAFQFELGGHILVRTNHAEILPVGNRPAGMHEDLMVIYPGAMESQAQATYWDNEGHRIEYSASWSADGNVLTFVSKQGPGPQFRLTYKKLDGDTFNISFDIAPPGQGGAFKTYTSGRIRREK